jgi:K319L-like, PKD domain
MRRWDRRPRRGRWSLAHRALALMLSWALPATTVWSAAPSTGRPLAATVAAAPTPTISRTVASCAEALSDGQAPVLTVARPELWPPNHALVDVGLDVDLTDACDGLASVHLTVFSDEPDDDQTGDGSQPVDAHLDGSDLYLRAEREGDGDGRVYLLAATATDAEGASGTDCGTVVVPHSRSKDELAAVRLQAETARSYCEANGTAPPDFHRSTEGDLVQANRAPHVDAGPDQAIDLGATATLDGTVSDDGLPSGVLQISWSPVSGPGSVTFSTPDAEDTAATFSAAGEYVLRLTADDTALSASDDVRVLVSAANEPPTVDAGPDQAITLPASSVDLQGAVSDDGRPSGILTATWSQLSGPGPVEFDDPASPATTARLPAVGEYVLRLTASDTQLEASDDVHRDVRPPGDVPPPPDGVGFPAHGVR